MSVPVVAEGAKALGDRFNLTIVVPLIIPSFAAAMMIRGHVEGWTFRPTDALPDLGDLTVAGAVALLSGVVLLGIVLAPLQINLTRVLEGYWGTGRLAVALGDVLTEIQRRRVTVLDMAMEVTGGGDAPRSSLDYEANSEREYRRESRRRALAARSRELFPLESGDVLPTRLGNILRRAEASAGERYGFGTIPAYPRLRQLTSQRLDDSLGKLLTYLDTASALTISFALASLVAAPLVVNGWWVLVPIACLVFSLAAYSGARVSAYHHGQLMRVAFDLHRSDLSDALGEAPETGFVHGSSDAVKANVAWTEFWRQGDGCIPRSN